jgi:hypothetical protein
MFDKDPSFAICLKIWSTGLFLHPR